MQYSVVYPGFVGSKAYSIFKTFFKNKNVKSLIQKKNLEVKMRKKTYQITNL